MIPWREVQPLEAIDGTLTPVLASVDTLRSAWEDAMAQISPEDFAEARKRSLRRHAIETGIIERLYDVDWGVTEALVAEGLTLDVAERVAIAAPPEPEARHWQVQLIRAAKAAEFYANLSDGSWWVRLRVVVVGQELRYIVAVQKVGHGETGVLAITALAEIVPPRDSDEEMRSLATPLFTTTSEDSVTMVHTDDLEAQWPDIREVIDRTLAAAIAEFGQLLG